MLVSIGNSLGRFIALDMMNFVPDSKSITDLYEQTTSPLNPGSEEVVGREVTYPDLHKSNIGTIGSPVRSTESVEMKKPGGVTPGPGEVYPKACRHKPRKPRIPSSYQLRPIKTQSVEEEGYIEGGLTMDAVTPNPVGRISHISIAKSKAGGERRQAIAHKWGS